MQDIDNNYKEGTFFIAYIHFPLTPGADTKRHRMVRRILPATNMAQTITAENLPEHFGVDKSFIREVKIVQAYAAKQNMPAGEHEKNLIKVDPKYFVTPPQINFNPVIIIQGTAYQRFFTEPFFVADLQTALIKMHRVCSTSAVINTVYTKIIKSIPFN